MKSNMTKHFEAKAKRGLCMAQGGLIEQQAQRLQPPQQPAQPQAPLAEPKQFGAAQFNTQDLMGMDRLTAGQYTNNPDILNAAMDAEPPQRYLDYSPTQTPMQANAQRTRNPVAPAPRQPLPQLGDDQSPQKWGSTALRSMSGGLRMAEGGMVPETAEQVMARMASKYGTTGAAQAAPVAQPTPAPVQAAPPPVQPPKVGMSGLLGRAVGSLRGADERLRQATNFAEGGIVRGKGGPTDDEVPMTIGGTDVNLSNKEAVLPVKTVDALGGPEAVEHLIETTNGKPPVRGGLRAGGGYFTGTGGDVIDPKALRPEFRGQAQTPVIQPAANAGLEATRNIRAENAGLKYIDPRATASPSAAPTPQAPTQPLPRGEQFGRNAAKVYTDLGGARGMAGKAINALVPAAAALDTMGDAGIRVEGNREGDATNETAGGMTRVANAAKEVGLRAGDWGTKGADMLMDLPLWALNKAGATSEGKPLEYGLINKNYRQGMRDANLAGVTIPQSSPEREMTQAPTKPKLRFEDLPQASSSNEGGVKSQPSVNPLSNDQSTLLDNTLGKDATLPQGLRGRWAGNDPMKAQQFTSADNAANGLRNNPANGHGVVSIKQKDGSFKNVLMGPSEYTAADGSKTSDWSKTSQFAQGTAQAAKDKVSLRDLEYSNAKFNATSDQITDPNARAAGLRGLAQYDVEEKQKAETAKNAASAESARIGHLLTERGQNITLAGHKAMQGNTDRAFKAEQDGKVAKRIKDSLDIAAPTEGLKDEALAVAKQNRADLEQALYAAHKTMPTSEAEYAQESPNMLNQSKLSVAMRNAVKNAGMLNRIGNVGHDMWTSLNALTPVKQGDNLVFEGGFTIPYKNVIGNDADLDAAYKARIAKVK